MATPGGTQQLQRFRASVLLFAGQCWQMLAGGRQISGFPVGLSGSGRVCCFLGTAIVFCSSLFAIKASGVEQTTKLRVLFDQLLILFIVKLLAGVGTAPGSASKNANLASLCRRLGLIVTM
jgi:hypothetical protein